MCLFYCGKSASKYESDHIMLLLSSSYPIKSIDNMTNHDIWEARGECEVVTSIEYGIYYQEW